MTTFCLKKPCEEERKESGFEEAVVEPVIYDIEPSNYRAASEPKRARYYHSLIDAKLLKSGTEYECLRKVVIIMILPYDPFGEYEMVGERSLFQKGRA